MVVVFASLFFNDFANSVVFWEIRPAEVHAVYRSVFGPELGDLEHVGIVDVGIWEVVDC